MSARPTSVNRICVGARAPRRVEPHALNTELSEILEVVSNRVARLRWGRTGRRTGRHGSAPRGRRGPGAQEGFDAVQDSCGHALLALQRYGFLTIPHDDRHLVGRSIE